MSMRSKHDYEHHSIVIFFCILTALVLIVLSLIFVPQCQAEPIPDEIAIRCIVGEAADQGKNGMYDLASGLLNRGTINGVYGCHADHVNSEPQWVFNMAKSALERAKIKRSHNGTHWENVKAFGEPQWAPDMKIVHSYKDHVFYLPRKRGGK